MDTTGKILLISVATMFSCVLIICLTQGDIACRFDSCNMYITNCDNNSSEANCTLILEYKPNSYCYEECEYLKCPKNNSVCKLGIWTKNCNINNKCNPVSQALFYISITVLGVTAFFLTAWFAFFWKPILTFENNPLMHESRQYEQI